MLTCLDKQKKKKEVVCLEKANFKDKHNLPSRKNKNQSRSATEAF